MVALGQGGQDGKGGHLYLDVAAAQQHHDMTRDLPTAAGMRKHHNLRTFPTAPPVRSLSSALGRRDPPRNRSTMTRCVERRTKELRNRCAGLRRGIREG
jgi:hypothetical protein